MKVNSRDTFLYRFNSPLLVGSSIDPEFSRSDEGHGLVDEIQYAKGHKYLTLVYQIDLGSPRLLWVAALCRGNRSWWAPRGIGS